MDDYEPGDYFIANVAVNGVQREQLERLERKTY
ncbi:MAG: hypothetical protein ACI9O2_000118 [Flammeovirgaceae bacterium]|jgi:hypothetical protein